MLSRRTLTGFLLGAPLGLVAIAAIIITTVLPPRPGSLTGQVSLAQCTSYTVKEFTIPTSGSLPIGIAAGPDGNLWFTQNYDGSKKIGRITPAGQITEYPSGIGGLTGLWGIAPGPDDAVWFTAAAGDRIGRIAPDGAVTQYPIPTRPSYPTGIVTGPDGNLWFTEAGAHAIDGTSKIGRITLQGVITEFPIRWAANDIAVGFDDDLWFVEKTANRVGRITTAGVVTEWDIPTDSLPISIAPGPDGNMWFTGGNVNTIGRITPDGEITEYTTSGSTYYIVTGPDGNLWFTEPSINKIGIMHPDGYIVDEIAIPTPSSNPWEITVGPDDKIWFVERIGNKIGRVECGAPTGIDDEFVTPVNVTLDVPVSGVLENDENAVGQTAVLLDNPVHGTVTLQLDGSFIYVPDTDYTGPDSFTYRVSGAGPEVTVSLLVTATAGSSASASTVSASGTSASFASSGSQSSAAGPGDICAPVCGDGLRIGTEQCDDRNVQGGDGCSSQCALECVQSSQCPSGSQCSGGTCSGFCGNGAVDMPGEQCDDGNTIDSDSCTNACITRCTTTNQCPGGSQCSGGLCAPLCGDGTRVAPEQCDDGNVRGGDGCSAQCSTECAQSSQCPAGNQCSAGVCTPLCGNGIIDASAGEQCDSGVQVSATCSQCRTLLCGGGVQCPNNLACQNAVCVCDPSHLCPQGQTCNVAGQCVSLCGNGVIDSGEQCDSGLQSSGTCSQCRLLTCSGAGQCGTNLCGPGNTCICDAAHPCPSGQTCTAQGQCISPVVCPADACGKAGTGGGTDFCANQGRNCVAGPAPSCISCVGDYTCQGTECGDGGDTFCASIGAASCSLEPQSDICISCAPPTGPACPADACGAPGEGGGTDFCAAQNRQCEPDPQSSSCIRCTGEAFVCGGTECELGGGKEYCAQIGKNTCTNVGGGICIDCGTVCPATACEDGGEAFCSQYGKKCIESAENESCITCAPQPALECSDIEDVCAEGAADYCDKAFNGASCVASPSSDTCFACIARNVCTGGECENGGSEYCSLLGAGCTETGKGICISCAAEQPLACQGNECRFGGADFCGRFGQGCRNGGENCVTCTLDSSCTDSSQCAAGSQCINRACVQTCGNGRLDQGEACDGGSGCTDTCLLEQNQQCTHDTECSSALCIKNICVPCTTGTQCQSNACQAGACRNLCGNGTKDPGEICDPGITGSADTCTNDCLLPAGAVCAGGIDCQTGLCGGINPTCQQCTRHSQCASNLCVSGACADLCGNGTVDRGETCDDGNRITGDGCDRFCGRESVVAGEILPVNLLGELTQRGPDLQGISGEGEAGRIATSHPAAGQTGPAAVGVIATGAAAGFAWMRRKRRRQ